MRWAGAWGGHRCPRKSEVRQVSQVIPEPPGTPCPQAQTQTCLWVALLLLQRLRHGGDVSGFPAGPQWPGGASLFQPKEHFTEGFVTCFQAFVTLRVLDRPLVRTSEPAVDSGRYQTKDRRASQAPTPAPPVDTIAGRSTSVGRRWMAFCLFSFRYVPC